MLELSLESAGTKVNEPEDPVVVKLFNCFGKVILVPLSVVPESKVTGPLCVPSPETVKVR